MNKNNSIIFIFLLTYISFNNSNAQIPIYNTEFKLSENSGNGSLSASCLKNGGIILTYGLNDGAYYDVYDVNGNRIVIRELFEEYGIVGNAKSAPLADGGFVITCRGDNLYGQVFDSLGNGGKKFRINNINEERASHPNVLGLSDGGFIVVWENNDGSTYEVYYDYEIYYKKYNNYGNEVSENIQVNSSIDGIQSSPNIVELINGNFVVVWVSKYKEFKDGYEWNRQHVLGQMFNTAGERVGSEFQVSTVERYVTTEYFDFYDKHHSPKICSLSNGGFVVVWVSESGVSGYRTISFQIYDQFSEKIGTETILTARLEVNELPSCIGLSSGGFAIAWKTHKYGFTEEIYCQIFNESGQKIGDQFQITEQTPKQFESLFMSKVSDKEFIIMWSTEDEGYTGSVYAKKYLQDPIQHNLETFYPISPINDVTIKPSKPLFTWKSASKKRINFPWELKYDLVIADNEEFSDPLVIENLIDTTYQMIYWLEPDYKYYWKVLAKNFYDDSLWSSKINSFYVDPNIVGVDIPKNQIPASTKLFQNYPNPFNPTTVIKYTIPVVDENFIYTTMVKLKVYDILGKEVAILVDKEQPAGSYEVTFEGNGLQSGVYYYRIKTNKFTKTRKMMLLQ